jgi:hypothetical protein
MASPVIQKPYEFAPLGPAIRTRSNSTVWCTAVSGFESDPSTRMVSNASESASPLPNGDSPRRVMLFDVGRMIVPSLSVSVQVSFHRKTPPPPSPADPQPFTTTGAVVQPPSVVSLLPDKLADQKSGLSACGIG